MRHDGGWRLARDGDDLWFFTFHSAAQGSCASDVNGDGVVNGGDIGAVLSDWGGTCSGTVTSVIPLQGSTLGGSEITITGTNLGGTLAVEVGGVACTNLQVLSSTLVKAVTPARKSAGEVAITVINAAGTATAANAFTYVIVPTWATLIEGVPDPAVVTDATLRNAIIASGFAWRVRDNGTQIEMVLAPGGTFTMGCTASNVSGCYSDEYPTHSVTITNAFYMGRYEVTQAQWLAKMGSNPSNFQPPSYTADTNRPVDGVSWTTIQGFLTATGMQLPTEAQWEYACRAGTTTAFHGFTGYLSGTNDATLVGNIAWNDLNSENVTHAVGGKAANGLGLHDMCGNVREWCRDWFGAYSAGEQTNPTGPASGSRRVLRGGSWSFGGFGSDEMRSSYRDYTSPGNGFYSVGFRVVRPPS